MNASVNGTEYIDYSLSKDEIVRGFNKFKEVLDNSVKYKSVFFKAFVNFTVFDESENRPPSGNVKVGFLVSKKNVNKATQRNKIKRLFRELYRKRKYRLSDLKKDANIIFSFRKEGQKKFFQEDKFNFIEFSSDFDELLTKILQAKN